MVLPYRFRLLTYIQLAGTLNVIYICELKQTNFEFIKFLLFF